MKPHHQSRRGFTVAELAVAALILGVVLVTIGQLAAGMAVHRQRSEAQRLAGQEAHNFAELLAALPFSETSNLDDLVAQQNADESRLVDFEANVEMSESSPLREQRLTIVARHRTNPGARCELIVWKHAREDES